MIDTSNLTIPELLRMRSDRIEQAEALMAIAESEARAFKPEELRTFDRLKLEAEAIHAAIENERRLCNPGGAREQVVVSTPVAPEPRY